MLAALFCVAALAGCGPEPQTTFGPAGSAAVNLKITMPQNVAAVAPPATGLWAKVQRWVWGSDAWAASAGEITGLVVRVTGPGIGTPIASPQVPVSGAVSGLVIPVTLEVPVGADRVFAVAALDAANRPIFQGQSAPVTLVADQPTTVSIQLTDTTIRIILKPLPDGTEDQSYTANLEAERGTGLTWTVPEGELPPGVRLDAATGALLGTSTRAGKFDFTIRVTDALGLFDEAPVTIRINPAPLPPKITTTTLPNGTVGAPYRATLVAVDGTGAPTWSVVTGAGTLPDGLQLIAATGVITGTPTKEGRATLTVRATDTTPLSDEQVLTITINPAPVPPTITTTTLPDGTTEAKYNAQLTATGGTGELTWTVVAGGLPDGLKLSDAGAITGTPTKNGTFGFTVRATDTMPLSREKALTITIKEAPKPPVITSTTLPGGKVGDPYSATLTATSTNGAVTWRVSKGVLPVGFSLGATTGVITGTPTAVGTVDFTVRATDAAGLFAEQLLFIQIIDKPKPPIITTTTLLGGTVNVAYQAKLTATGGTGAVTWSVVAGALPGGLTLNATTGSITGTPTAAGTVGFTVRATDTTPLGSEKALTITIQPPILPPTITTDSVPAGRVGEVYSTQLTATSPNGAVTWSVSTGALPTGLTLNGTTGIISGTPTEARTFDVTVRATDPRNLSDDQTLSIKILGRPPVITTTSLPGGKLGNAYSATLTATSQNGPVTWTASSLPDGLQVDRTSGVITGTPTVAATFGVTVRATDARNLFSEKVLSLEIRQNPPVITTTTLPVWIPEDEYNVRLQVTGGIGAVTWSLVTGQLPCCLELNSATGEIAGGNDSGEDTFPFTVRATDSVGRFDEQALAIIVRSRPESPVITTTSLPDGTVGASYSATVEATGGTGARTWTVDLGFILPPGLQIASSTGAITGIPTFSGTYRPTVRVTDANGQSSSRELSITIAPPLSITTTSLPLGIRGLTYGIYNAEGMLISSGVQLDAQGGSDSKEWGITKGDLPPGLSLSISGKITGIVSCEASATYTPEFEVRDANKASARKELTLNIASQGCIN